MAVATTAVLALVGLARWGNQVPQGLRASYFTTADWSSPAALSAVEVPSIQGIFNAWGGRPPDVFSADWTGSMIILQEANYTFATTSDDGSWLYLDDELVVDNGGSHPPRTVTASIRLSSGVHSFRLKYFQGADQIALDVAWAHGDRPLHAVPGWLFTPEHPPFWRFAADVVLRWLLIGGEWLWVAVMLAVVVGLAWPFVVGAYVVVRQDSWWRAAAAVIAVSVAINVTGIWCGLLADTGITGDELSPRDVGFAVAARFSNGWWMAYPPVQYYLLALVYSPVLLLGELGRIDPWAPFWNRLLFLVARVVSLAAGMGVLIAMYRAATDAFSKRAGVFAIASLALVVPFIAYSRSANVDAPYVFWFALSLVFYLRLLREPTRRDMIMFAMTGTLAICTKDNAYGLYIATPFVLVYAIGRARQRAGESHPFARALVDQRLLVAVAVTVLVFVVCHNVLFNYSGVSRRFQHFVNDAGTGYRAVMPTLTGRLQLLALTARLDQQSWGWPLLLVSVAGWMIALASRPYRYATVALSIMVASYYLTFINLLLYSYDRFLLPVCVVQALFAGVALDRWFEAPASRLPWRRIGAGGVFAYSLLYAGMVDVLMLRDSRYEVDRWLHARAASGQVIGTAFEARNRPRLDGFRIEKIETVAHLMGALPAYYVVDADYARWVPADTAMAELLRGLRGETLGYRLALRYRSPTPWAWLPGAHPDLAGPRLDPPTSSLREINPTFEVYERRP